LAASHPGRGHRRLADGTGPRHQPGRRRQHDQARATASRCRRRTARRWPRRARH